MEKIREIIEEKYYWRPEYRTAMQWAELALEQGSDAIEVVSYVTGKLFQKAVN